MVYKYRVTLDGIKGFYRLYIINSANSLYTFHKQLRDDLEFPVDQPILFKAFDANGNVVARYALMDIGYGSVDNVTIADTIKGGVSSFVYFYDTQAKKSVTVTLEGESTEKTTAPRSIEAKGPVPAEFENGYVAFEDMPKEPRHIHLEDDGHEGGEEDPDEEDLDNEEDDDDDEDEDSEDKEEDELVYDENEQ